MNSAFRNPDTFFQTVSRPKRYVTYPAGTAIGVSEYVSFELFLLKYVKYNCYQNGSKYPNQKRFAGGYCRAMWQR